MAAGRTWTPWLRPRGLTVAVVVVDQLTKHLIADHITPGDSRSVVPGVHFVHTMNDGVAFGLSLGNTAIVLIVIFAVLALLVAYFARRPSRPWVWLPTGLILGGALSNAYDRVHDGSSPTSSSCRSAGRRSTSPTSA